MPPNVLRTAFNVSIAKDNNCITFEIVYEDNQISVMHLAYEPKEGYDENTTMYTGTNINKLKAHYIDETNSLTIVYDNAYVI